MRSRNDRAGLAAKVITFLTVIGALMGGLVGVALSQPAPSDGAGGAYPPPLPTGCTVETVNLPGGASVVDGEAFAINGESVPLTNRNVGGTLSGGDQISVTWQGTAAGCEGLGFSLALKATERAAGFDPNDNQELVDFVYCGPGGADCTAQGNTLTLQMPSAVDVPCWQVDFVIGTPLAVVGPDGGYYRFQQPIDMLIASKNGGVSPCDSAPPCPTNPNIIAASFECREAQLTPTPTTTVVPAPAPAPVAQPVPAPAPAPAPVPAPAPAPVPAPVAVDGGGSSQGGDGSSIQIEDGPETQVEANVVVRQPDAELPFTGAGHRALSAAAALTMFVGALLTYATRRPQGAHYRA